MLKFLRLTITLAAIAAAAALALAATYGKTRGLIEQQQLITQTNALQRIFRQGFAKAQPVTAAGGQICYYAIYSQEGDAQPCYFAAIGRGAGYNSSVPVELLVGFTNPAARQVPEQGGKRGCVITGWKVVRSEETPGLGEKIKESKPAATWLDGGPWAETDPAFDSRTDFQKQFVGRTVAELGLKSDGVANGLDAITGATITSRGIVAAIKDAHVKLQESLLAVR